VPSSFDDHPSGMVSSITMTKCKGITFSHLLTGSGLTPGRLRCFLDGLHEIHSSKGGVSPNATSEALPTVAEIAQNLSAKIEGRFSKHSDLYASLSESLGGDGYAKLALSIIDGLKEYESANRCENTLDSLTTLPTALPSALRPALLTALLPCLLPQAPDCPCDPRRHCVFQRHSQGRKYGYLPRHAWHARQEADACWRPHLRPRKDVSGTQINMPRHY
jgi:hypothetical protein